jgi:hypothetical protein
MTNNQIEVKKFITPEVKKKMTTWEKEFISSIYKREAPWTEKQLDVFNNIKKKYKLVERIVVEKVVYLPMGHAAPENQFIMTRKMRKQIGIYRNAGAKLK